MISLPQTGKESQPLSCHVVTEVQFLLSAFSSRPSLTPKGWKDPLLLLDREGVWAFVILTRKEIPFAPPHMALQMAQTGGLITAVSR